MKRNSPCLSKSNLLRIKSEGGYRALDLITVMATQTPHSHVPFGDDGSGFYSDHTIGCYNVIKEAEQLLVDSAAKRQINGQTFCIVDYGTADGGTSMPVLQSVIRKLRQIHGDRVAIHIIYEDQPTNDFKSLFLRLQGLIAGPPSYLLMEKNVYVSACGTGFYSQCLPPNSVDLGLSATSMHWLSKKPCNITGALHHTMITDPKEKELFVAQAAEDWETILLHRAAEMRTGSRLVLAQLAVDDDGQFLGRTQNIKHSMHEVMRDIFRAMVTDGKVTEEEFTQTTFLNYYRTIAEFSFPFLNPDSAVSQAGLKLISIETKVIRCPYHSKWLTNGGDPLEHAKWYVPTTRTWSNHTIYSGLSTSRTESERRGLVDEFYTRYEDIVAKNPSEHGMDYINAYLVIEKV